jgi:peptide/nickel transport system substrate-binding protein
LAKADASVPYVMPERLARTDPMKAITEVVGSGPYRFLPDEYVSGARVAYARFDG